VTAAVVGLFRPFRYLLITPRLAALLTDDELRAVVSHEIGHVRKRHLLFYLVFMLTSLWLASNLLAWLPRLLMLTPGGMSLLARLLTSGESALLQAVAIGVALLFFVLYFRYVFGFFMRRFERQADVYCIAAGIGAQAMISTFAKLQAVLGERDDEPNWHHYSLAQRRAFLVACQDDPHVGVRFERRLRLTLAGTLAGLALLLAATFNPFSIRLGTAVDLRLMATLVEQRLAKEPRNPQLYSVAAEIAYERQLWPQAKRAYETALQLDRNQPEALNNLAWMLLTCPAPDLRDLPRALALAEEAVRQSPAPHIWDTLAEAYLANGRLADARQAALKALALADDNRDYYRTQLNKINARLAQNN
jgi:predicted Zn-dependent protease